MCIFVVQTRISSYWVVFLQNIACKKEIKPDSDLFMVYAKDYSDETFSIIYHGTCSAFLI